MKADRTIRLVSEEEKIQWDTVVCHPLQSWSWGQFRTAMGLDVVRLGVFQKNKLIEGWQITFHPIPFTNFTVGYFPKGPKPTDEMLQQLRSIAKKKHAVYIQLEPDIPVEDQTSLSDAVHFVPSHRPLFTRYTFVLNLSRSEEELSSAMHSKTRYNIRVAQKHGVSIQEDNSDKAFTAYLSLAEETTHRQGFYAHSRMYHKTMWNILHTSGIAHLFTATYENKTLAAWIVFVWKDTIYYPYGASSRDHRDVMAPNLLLWEIVRWAKKQGLNYFDLWGALGSNPDPNDPWYGFHRFKEGYKPDLVEFAGSYDFIVQSALYRLYTIADSLRWTFLKLKSGH